MDENKSYLDLVQEKNSLQDEINVLERKKEQVERKMRATHDRVSWSGKSDYQKKY